MKSPELRTAVHFGGLALVGVLAMDQASKEALIGALLVVSMVFAWVEEPAREAPVARARPVVKPAPMSPLEALPPAPKEWGKPEAPRPAPRAGPLVWVRGRTPT